MNQLRSDFREDMNSSRNQLFFAIAGLNIAVFGLLLAAIKWI
jgi:hypothetical protein